MNTPPIVCLCGSTRFYDAFQAANYRLTMEGKIVLSVGFYPHAKAQAGHGEGVGHDSAEKVALDELHKRKIDLADYVYVVNPGGYIGASTASEILYALEHRKPVFYEVPLSLHTMSDEARKIIETAASLACPTCQTGAYRETVGMVCQTCGRDYAKDPDPKWSGMAYAEPPTVDEWIADLANGVSKADADGAAS